MHTDAEPTRGPHPLFGQLLTNAEALREQEDDLIAEHGACAVLMVDRVVIQAFDNHASAVQAGKERFGSGNFSAHTLPVPVVYAGVLTASAAPSERG
ncbi:MAG: hypothetical protein OXG91_02175 [bacterium]|nr:hypothetical protein [bacterium]